MAERNVEDGDSENNDDDDVRNSVDVDNGDEDCYNENGGGDKDEEEVEEERENNHFMGTDSNPSDISHDSHNINLEGENILILIIYFYT